MSRTNRKAIAFGIAGVAALIVLPAASLLTPAADMPAFALAGLVVFVFCGARALRLSRADGLVFDDAQRRGRYHSPAHGNDDNKSVLDNLHRRTISRHP